MLEGKELTETSGKLIYGKIPAIMADMKPVPKDRECSQGFRYKFRGIDDVMNALQGVMAKHEVFCYPEVRSHSCEERKSSAGKVLIFTLLKVKYTLCASDGSSIESIVFGEAMDSGDKGTNKAMSAAMKYFLLQTFCIPTDEPKDTEDEAKVASLEPQKPSKTEGHGKMPLGQGEPSKADISFNRASEFVDVINKIDNWQHLANWWKKHAREVGLLLPNDFGAVLAAKNARKEQLVDESAEPTPPPDRSKEFMEGEK